MWSGVASECVGFSGVLSFPSSLGQLRRERRKGEGRGMEKKGSEREERRGWGSKEVWMKGTDKKGGVVQHVQACSYIVM